MSETLQASGKAYAVLHHTYTSLTVHAVCLSLQDAEELVRELEPTLEDDSETLEIKETEMVI